MNKFDLSRSAASIVFDPRWVAYFAFLEVVVIFAVDAIFVTFRRLPLPVEAILDELGHGATALLVLGVVRLGLAQPAVVGTVIGATMIDMDHLPMVLGWDALIPAAVRPYTHSLFTVWVLALIAGPLPGSLRWAILSMAFGVMTHLLRDMADGGVPLLWPVTRNAFALPYAAYAALVIVAACLVAWGGHLRHLYPFARQGKGRN